MSEKVNDSVKVFLKLKGISLKEAIEKGYVRKNYDGIYVMTGKGNKFKQKTTSTHPKKYRWLNYFR